MEYNLGIYPENTIIENSIIFPKKVTSALGSCGCTTVSYKDNQLNFKWKLPAFPFQLESDKFEVGITIDVWLEDRTKLTEYFKATITK